MKKMLCMALAMMLALSLIGTAVLAEEFPQPEGGKKFESCWGFMGGLITINYEEEGYRVMVDLYNQSENTGTIWEYSCYYNEEKDVLESISSRKSGYTLDPETLNVTLGEPEYEGLDLDDNTSVFSLSEDGALTWTDGRENTGSELEFRDIGNFAGVWRNEAEDVYAEFQWDGLYDENTYFYYIFLARGEDAEFRYVGAYDPEAGKLICYDADAVGAEDAQGLFEALNAGTPCDAAFTDLGNGKLLYEGEGTIELEYDLMGPES